MPTIEQWVLFYGEMVVAFFVLCLLAHKHNKRHNLQPLSTLWAYIIVAVIWPITLLGIIYLRINEWLNE